MPPQVNRTYMNYSVNGEALDEVKLRVAQWLFFF
jgi:hypothetical protein